MRDFFYKPEEGYVGDVIPYYEDGTYYLYYLYNHRNTEKYGEGTSWYLITTKDFVSFKEHGEVLAHRTEEYQDLNAYTGSIYKNQDTYYLYYTGYNAHPRFCVQEAPLQAVMLAKSDNLMTWEKLPQGTFYASEEFYELSDWRDPFVFHNDEEDEYWMLLASRLRQGSVRRRGCVGLCKSKDLLNWKAAAPFYSPGLYMTHECPEVFKMGQWWYLVYSSFSERFATHYRMSGSLSGPFVSPAEDTFDGRGFYAGKTASDGISRYIFGWVPTRKAYSDYGNYEWAGNLIVHELMQRDDGTLYARLPKSMEDAFACEVPFSFDKLSGHFTGQAEGVLKADSGTAFSTVVSGQELPVRCMITAKFKFQKDTRALGILLRSDEEADRSYYIRLEPDRNRMVFDMWPRKIKKPEEDTWEINGDRPFFTELERSCQLKAGQEYKLTILLDDTVCSVYLEGQTAMTSRVYNIKKGRLGVFVSEGNAEFYDIHVNITAGR